MLLNSSEAADCLHRGQIIAYPTEAVFGIGCDPRDETAVTQLLSLKQRPASTGLILIGSDIAQFSSWVGDAPEEQLRKAALTWPGPVTWLFPRGDDVPDAIAGAHDTVAIRVTAHAPCIELCEAFGGPVVSTSANPHSLPPARSAGEVETYFGSYLGGILAGPLGGRSGTSEIRDLATGEVIRASST